MNILDKLKNSIINKKIDYASTMAQLDAMYDKIYGEHSNSINALDSSFIPYATHILKFIEQWVIDNPEYGYELISTRRSWYSQKKVTTIYDDFKNGLSWYIYGNALSINVFKKVSNELFSNGGPEDLVHSSINFNDGSAKKFILDANAWFNNNPIEGTDRVIKIFGIYPSLKECLSKKTSDLFAKYKDDPDVVYWGGLFSGYSNFTHWEWHPGYLPNEIWKVRELFLNDAFSNIDFNELLHSEGQLSEYNKKFLSNHISIIEEDLMSIIKLKNKINLSREYSIIELFDWANANEHSLRQMIQYYIVTGDYNNRRLFEILREVAPSITLKYDPEGRISIVGGNNELSITYNDESYYLRYYNEFGDIIYVSQYDTYMLPVDHKLLSNEFDLVELTIDDTFSDLYSSTLSNVSIEQVISEIEDMSIISPDNRFEINEHGLIGELSILPEKILSVDETISLVNSQLVFEEMITPPNQTIINKNTTSKILDISNIKSTKDIRNSDVIDQMVNPEEMF